MIRVTTFAELSEQHYELALYCIVCDRWGKADLVRLVETGLGNKRLSEARFRCSDCGEIVDKQLRPPVPEPGGSVAYI